MAKPVLLLNAHHREHHEPAQHSQRLAHGTADNLMQMEAMETFKAVSSLSFVPVFYMGHILQQGLI